MKFILFVAALVLNIERIVSLSLLTCCNSKSNAFIQRNFCIFLVYVQVVVLDIFV